MSSQAREGNQGFLTIMLGKFDEIMLAAIERGSEGGLSQLVGLYRLWGHPTVNGKMGVNKLHQITQQNRAINISAIKTVSKKWREYFTISYFHKNHRLPHLQDRSLRHDNYLTR